MQQSSQFSILLFVLWARKVLLVSLFSCHLKKPDSWVSEDEKYHRKESPGVQEVSISFSLSGPGIYRCARYPAGTGAGHLVASGDDLKLDSGSAVRSHHLLYHCGCCWCYTAGRMEAGRSWIPQSDAGSRSCCWLCSSPCWRLCTIPKTIAEGQSPRDTRSRWDLCVVRSEHVTRGLCFYGRGKNSLFLSVWHFHVLYNRSFNYLRSNFVHNYFGNLRSRGKNRITGAVLQLV